MKKIIILTIILLAISIEGFTQYVKIGSQVWSSKNLNVSKFRNGDPIPQALSAEDWERASSNGEPAWCYYDNDPKNGPKYGKLYNWYAVNDPRGLAPAGWHIPSENEWRILINFIGASAGTKLKSNQGWFNNGNGTNSAGFSALPGGYRYSYGSFLNIEENGNWWTSTETGNSSAWQRVMNCRSSTVVTFDGIKGSGQSVRCIKN